MKLNDTFGTLYRLFAPLFVVILIIGGVNLGSELVQNSTNKQPALATAYAGGCPMGTAPVGTNCNVRDSKGRIKPLSCKAISTFGGKTRVITGICTEYGGIGCCMGTNWDSATKTLREGGGSGGVGSALGGMGQSILGQMMQSLMQKLMQGGGGGGSSNPYNQVKPPKCTKLVSSTSLPIKPGEGATLSWVLDGGTAESVIVSPGVGAVRGYSVRVYPNVSTTYTVTVRNRAGSSTCPKVRVHVGPRDSSAQTTGTTTDSGSQTDGYSEDVVNWDGGSSTSTGNTYDDINTDGSVATSTASSSVPDLSYGNNVSDEYYKNNYKPTYYYGGISDQTQNSNASTTQDTNSTDVWQTDNTPQYTEEVSGFSDTNVAIDSASGLTDAEVYGVWNRPTNPATGGLLGNYSDTDYIATGNDSVQSEVGWLSSLFKWFKNIFCFWCN